MYVFITLVICVPTGSFLLWMARRDYLHLSDKLTDRMNTPIKKAETELRLVKQSRKHKARIGANAERP